MVVHLVKKMTITMELTTKSIYVPELQKEKKLMGLDVLENNPTLIETVFMLLTICVLIHQREGLLTIQVVL